MQVSLFNIHSSAKLYGFKLLMIILLSKQLQLQVSAFNKKYSYNVSSSSRAANTDFPDSLSLSLSPFVPNFHHSRQIFLTTSCVGQHLHVHVYGSIEERHWRVRPDLFNSFPHVLFVLLRWFLRREVACLFCCGIGVT